MSLSLISTSFRQSDLQEVNALRLVPKSWQDLLQDQQERYIYRDSSCLKLLSACLILNSNRLSDENVTKMEIGL